MKKIVFIILVISILLAARFIPHPLTVKCRNINANLETYENYALLKIEDKDLDAITSLYGVDIHVEGRTATLRIIKRSIYIPTMLFKSPDLIFTYVDGDQDTGIVAIPWGKIDELILSDGDTTVSVF